MITKEQFVKWFEGFMEKREIENAVYDTLYEVAGIDMNNFISNISYEALAIDALKMALGIKEDTIEFFLYECDAKFEKFNDAVFTPTGKPNLSSFADLYDYIIKEN